MRRRWGVEECARARVWGGKGGVRAHRNSCRVTPTCTPLTSVSSRHTSLRLRAGPRASQEQGSRLRHSRRGSTSPSSHRSRTVHPECNMRQEGRRYRRLAGDLPVGRRVHMATVCCEVEVPDTQLTDLALAERKQRQLHRAEGGSSPWVRRRRGSPRVCRCNAPSPCARIRPSTRRRSW